MFGSGAVQEAVVELGTDVELVEVVRGVLKFRLDGFVSNESLVLIQEGGSGQNADLGDNLAHLVFEVVVQKQDFVVLSRVVHDVGGDGGGVLRLGLDLRRS